MNNRKYIAWLTAAVMGLGALAGCASSGGESTAAESAPLSSSSQPMLQTNEARSMVHVGALQGPTGLGLVGLMEKNEQKQAENVYEFTLAGAPDEISGKLVSGELDIASVPTNLAATLYAKTEGKVKVIAVNTLGVLYLLHREPDADPDTDTDEDADGDGGVTSFADLAGKTIHTTGQGATQEYVLNYLLAENGVTDAEIVYHAEHAALASLLLEGRAEYALLPQPFVTTVTARDEAVEILLDVTKEWEAATGGNQLAMGAVVVRSEFLEINPDAVDQFLAELAESVDFVGSSVDEAAALAEKFDVIAESVAQKAIPQCNIVCLTGQDMRDSVAPYLEILESADSKSVGGALPDDAFYYIPA